MKMGWSNILAKLLNETEAWHAKQFFKDHTLNTTFVINNNT